MYGHNVRDISSLLCNPPDKKTNDNIIYSPAESIDKTK